MSFKRWIKNADKDLNKILEAKLQHGLLFRDNSHKNYLLSYYAQYKTFSETRKLVIATWILAGATIALAIITSFL